VPLALTGYEIGLLAVACVFIVFALIVALVVPRARPDFPAKRLGVFVAVCIVLFAAQMGAVLALAELGEAHESEAAATTETTTETTETETTEAETTETTEGQTEPVGKVVFESAGCVSCHTLADAGASGTIGPNLDQSMPSHELVVDRVTNGQGAMPSFADSLSEEQIEEVAAYVSAAAGG
jgi:mono/diheme cytochrome c family protein